MNLIITPSRQDFIETAKGYNLNYMNQRDVIHINRIEQLYGRNLKNHNIIWGRQSYLFDSETYKRLKYEVLLRGGNL